jgi:UrcA family protein
VRVPLNFKGTAEMSNRDYPADRSMRAGLAHLMVLMAAIASFTPMVALAAPEPGSMPETVSARVSLADLNLFTSEGRREASARLRTMADQLCHKVVDSRRVAARSLHEDCAREALADALRRLDAVVQVARS